MTNTSIDFSMKPGPDWEAPFDAYFHTADLPSCEPWTRVTVEAMTVRNSRPYALVDFEGMPTYASLDDLRLPAWVCEECGGRVIEQRPTACHGRYLHNTFSHPDGEPLCPTVGAEGYEPCKAV
ncbi:MAG: hypothetical protein IPK85_03005 [Gemmatimonadetes bacterium]|nr:hypothetical protein [Gemmatimonadota bacterium]